MIKGAYIHIPFCEQICYYCDFNKVFLQGQPVDEYLQALRKEIQLTLKDRKTPLQSIFVGGGTPTALNEKQLATLCEIIITELPVKQPIEFTFEANPSDLSKEKLQILYDAGVNRLSFGVQTFNDELLEKIGRTHRKKDVLKTVHLAKEVGFQNISMDLIYRLPGQTIDDFHETLMTAFELPTTHFSAYSLIVEPKTRFYHLMRLGRLPLPSEEVEALMYELVMEEMEKHGYYQYEISNFAKSGYESKHNLTYWNNEEYYGFGAGAHSYVDGIRRENYAPLKKYMEPLEKDHLPIREEFLLTKKEKMEEEMFLGLRKTRGVSRSLFIKKYGIDPLELYSKEIKELVKNGLLIANEEHIHLTKKGKLLGNEVFEAFLLPDDM